MPEDLRHDLRLRLVKRAVREERHEFRRDQGLGGRCHFRYFGGRRHADGHGVLPHEEKRIPGRAYRGPRRLRVGTPIGLVQPAYPADDLLTVTGRGDDLVFQQVPDSPHPSASSGKLPRADRELIGIGHQDAQIRARRD